MAGNAIAQSEYADQVHEWAIGGWSLRLIADELCKRGLKVSHTTVKRYLANNAVKRTLTATRNYRVPRNGAVDWDALGKAAVDLALSVVADKGEHRELRRRALENATVLIMHGQNGNIENAMLKIEENLSE